MLLIAINNHYPTRPKTVHKNIYYDGGMRTGSHHVQYELVEVRVSKSTSWQKYELVSVRVGCVRVGTRKS